MKKVPVSVRLMNFFIDGAFVVSFYLSALLLDIYMGSPILVTDDIHQTFGLGVWLAIMIATLLVFYALYYLVCEVLIGTTFGHHVSATKVVDEQGEEPTRSQLVKRALARLIPLDPFTFFARYPVGLHDKLSGTRLVIKQEEKRRLLF
jgi:uncharacterized RDD family membrane protein YckC